MGTGVLFSRQNYKLIIMIDHHQYFVVLITIELFIETSNSLKSKRSVMTRTRERIKSEFNVSIAEVGFQQKWQRAAFALTMVGNDRKIIQKDLAAFEVMVGAMPDVTVTAINTEWL